MYCICLQCVSIVDFERPKLECKQIDEEEIILQELEKSLTNGHIASKNNFSRTEDALRIVKNIQNSQTSSSIPLSVSTTGGPVKCARCKFCPSSNGNKTNMLR
ncbi:hypothetical protein C0J52_19859 [Blattella germanica]|nr:hypothetical protein C0J52_19859 [Blattella germanica]